MIYIDYIFIFIAALTIGSFLNVLIWRIPQRQSIVFPASHCTQCGASLKPKDLIPLLSYIFLKGKCRTCGVGISLRYPTIEVVNAMLWLVFYFGYGMTLQFLLYSAVASVLLVITMIDWEHQIIPDSLSIFIFAMAVLFFLQDASYPILYDRLIGILAGGGGFFLLLLFTGAMGDGDVVLMAVLGALVGWKLVLLIALLAFVIGAVVCIPLVAAKKTSGKTAIPFGPFIAVSATVVLLYGEPLVQWYIIQFVK